MNEIGKEKTRSFFDKRNTGVRGAGIRIKSSASFLN
jgi:hypothetical protein